MQKIALIFFALFSLSLLFPQRSFAQAGSNPTTTECPTLSIDMQVGTSEAQLGALPNANTAFIVKVQWAGINPGTTYKIEVRRQTTGAPPAVTNVTATTAGELVANFTGVPPGNYSTLLSVIDPNDSTKEFFICRSRTFTIAQGAATRPAEPATNTNPVNERTVPDQQGCKPGDKNCTAGGGLRCDPYSGAVNIPNGGGIMTAIGCIPTEPQKLVEGILRYGTLGAGGIAFLIMIIAAIQMITAEGNPNTIKTSQEKFYSAIIGLLLIIFSVLLMQVIGVDLLGLQGFGR